MMLNELKIRAAELHEEAKVLLWRNHEKVRRGSMTNKIISPNAHEQWFKERVKNNQFFIAEKNGKEFGVVCYEKDEEDVVWSFYVVPDMQGKGMARTLMQLGLIALRSNGIDLVYADVKDDNEASLKLHVELGFIVYAARDNVVKYYKELTSHGQL